MANEHQSSGVVSHGEYGLVYMRQLSLTEITDSVTDYMFIYQDRFAVKGCCFLFCFCFE